MAVKNTVDLKGMMTQAREISAKGAKMAVRFHNVFDKDITELSAYWSGGAYRNLIKYVNTLDDDLNRITRYFQFTLPEAIAKKRNIYAKASGKTKVPIANAHADSVQADGNPLHNLPMPSETDEIAFDEDKVQETRETMYNRFTNVETDLDDIQNAFLKIKWQGETGDELRKTVNARIKRTQSLISKIKSALKENMTNAAKAMQRAEKGNAVSTSDVVIENIEGTANDLEKSGNELESSVGSWQDET